METTRRNLISATLVGAAAASVAASMPLMAQAETSEDPCACNVNVLGEMEAPAASYESDVVVIGAGPAGIACATRAAELGAKVQIVEKRDSIGGTGLFASGNCYISLNSQYQLEQGLEADIPAFYKEWLEAVHYHCDHDILGTYLRNCGRVVDWLRGYGFDFFMKDVPPTNGLSGNAYRISQPARDSGVREAAYGAMMDAVTAAGGSIAFETVAQELIVDAEGTVVGVRCADAAGAVVDYMGKAVVVACGGYAANVEMINALSDVPLLGRDPVQNMGEGAKMSWAAGAAKPWNLGILCCDTLYPIDAEYHSYPGGIQPLGNVMNDFGKSRLHVNDLGKRFHSENPFCWVPTYAGANAIGYNEPWLYVVCDQAALDEAGIDATVIEDYAGYGAAYKGDTIEELAEAMGVDPATLAETVAQYNEFCANGEDPVFYKEAAFLVPIGEGPYYAGRFAATPFGSCGDLCVTTEMQVRGAERGTVVEGLYAIGTETVGMMHNDYYWALGQTVGWGHISGCIAAEAICAKL